MTTVVVFLIGFIITFILLKLWSDLNSTKKKKVKTSTSAMLFRVVLSMIWPLTLAPLMIAFIIKAITGLFQDE